MLLQHKITTPFYQHGIIPVGGCEGGAICVGVHRGCSGGAVTVDVVCRWRGRGQCTAALGLRTLGPTHLHHALEVHVHRVGELEGLKTYEFYSFRNVHISSMKCDT